MCQFRIKVAILLVISKYMWDNQPRQIFIRLLFSLSAGLCRSTLGDVGDQKRLASSATSKDNIEVIKAKAEAAARSASAMVIELEKALDSK